VGTVDNFLRPLLVGKDTKMPDLLVLLSTVGGISLFGAVGFVVGPVIAALFLAVYRIYGETFGDLLAGPQSVDGGG
jgi:predicted PurR-regulated permease PerM